MSEGGLDGMTKGFGGQSCHQTSVFRGVHEMHAGGQLSLPINNCMHAYVTPIHIQHTL